MKDKINKTTRKIIFKLLIEYLNRYNLFQSKCEPSTQTIQNR